MTYYTIHIKQYEAERNALDISKPKRIRSHAEMFLQSLVDNFVHVAPAWVRLSDPDPVVIIDVDENMQQVRPYEGDRTETLTWLLSTLHGLSAYESFQKVLDTMRKSGYSGRVIQRIVPTTTS